MSSKFVYVIAFFAALVIGSAEINGQKRRNKRPTPTPDVAATEKANENEPTVKSETVPAKKNARAVESERPAAAPQSAISFTHIYEFRRPEFTVDRVSIKHDDKGRGEITFSKNGSDETITDPIQLTPTTLERITDALTELDFLNSTENYQFEKDYSHLGNITFTLKACEKTRSTTYNWTLNKAAKVLMDEYRRIGQQYVWMFDIGVARSNQPLEAPKLMETLDGYFRRGEISDPEQMIPILRELSDEERIPLMARNRAARLVKQIEAKRDKAAN